MNQITSLQLRSLRIFATSILVFLCCSVSHAETRTWTDSSGKHQIEAELVEFKDGQVKLKRNGRILTLSLSKFSKADQEFLKKASSKPTTDAAKKPNQLELRKIIKAFVSSLTKEENEGSLEYVISGAEEAANEIGKLPTPDRRSQPFVRKMTTDGDSVKVPVSYKVKGRLRRFEFTFVLDEDTWKIASIQSTGNTEDESIEVSFVAKSEESPDEQPESKDDSEKEVDDDPDKELVANKSTNSTTTEDSNDEDRRNAALSAQFQVPQGATTQELLQFMDQLKATKPPENASAEAKRSFAQNRAESTLEAADQCLYDPDISKQALKLVGQSKLRALHTLTQLDPDSVFSKVDVLADDLEDLELEELVPHATSLQLTAELVTSNAATGEKLIDKIEKHLGKFSKISPIEISLAKAATTFAKQLDPVVAKGIHQRIGKILIKHPASKRQGELLLKTASR